MVWTIAIAVSMVPIYTKTESSQIWTSKHSDFEWVLNSNVRYSSPDGIVTWSAPLRLNLVPASFVDLLERTLHRKSLPFKLHWRIKQAPSTKGTHLKNKSQIEVQWGSENRKCLVFKWSKFVKSSNDLVFECQLNTQLNLVKYSDHHLST